MKATQSTTHFAVALLLATLAGTALAAEPSTQDAGVLGGPAIVESSGPDAGDSMTGAAAESRRAGDMPFRSYLGAVRGLNKAAQDNPELALTEDQKDQIREISKAHQEKMKAFMEEHKEEFGEMRGNRGDRGEAGEQGQRRPVGQRGDAGQRGQVGEAPERGARGQRGERAPEDAMGGGERPEVSPEERQRMRERLGDLMANAPSDAEAKKALWSVLTADQQVVVKENIAQMRSQRENRVDRAMGAQNEKGERQAKGKAKGKAKSRDIEDD